MTRGILGLRAEAELQDWRLSLRAGAGLIGDTGHTLGRPVPGAVMDTRTGVVARLGASLEQKLSPLLWLGLGVHTEAFTLDDDIGVGLGAESSGTAIFANLSLRFELGL